MHDAERLRTRAAIDATLGADRTLRVHIGGAWELGDGLPSTRLVEQALTAPDPPRAVTFETTGLASWDSSVLLVLRKIDGLCRSRRVSVALDGLPEDNLLELAARLRRAVSVRLGAGFMLVDTLQPGTLRLRLAITAAEASDPIVDVRTASPHDEGRNPKTGPLGKELAAFIEAAVIEGELRDAMTGELIAQGIDRRASGAPPPLPTWEALDRGLAFWADGTFAGLEAHLHGR